jgi:hypothetical protein
MSWIILVDKFGQEAAGVDHTRVEKTQVRETSYISERSLALRWDVSVRTVQRLRVRGEGPPFLRIGNTIRYGTADLEEYEERLQGMGANPK